MNHNHISLYYFTIVVEEMNISNAAKRLFIAQQSLSDHIRRLEKQFDTVLFERTPRLKLTYAGEKLLEYAQTVLKADEMLTYSISEYQTASRKKLNIGAASHRCNLLLPDLIDLYSIEHPNILLSVYEGPTELLSTMLHSGRIDLYFSLHEPSVSYGKNILLFMEESYFIISRSLLKTTFGSDWKQFLLDHRDGIEPPDMARFPLVMPSNFSPMRAILDKYFASYSVCPKIYFETSNYMASHKTCSHGHCGCITSLPFQYSTSFDRNAENPVYALPVKGIEGLSSFNLTYSEASERHRYILDFIKDARISSEKINREIKKSIKSQFEFIV